MNDSYAIKLKRVLQRIEAAQILCGRKDEVKLIAVSKKFSAAEIQQFYALGLRDFGENYIQEWEAKRVQLPQDIVWHIIGNVQSNKTRVVAEYAAWLHTLDRSKIALRLNQQRPQNQPPLNICIEVNIGQRAQKHGILLPQLNELVEEVLKLPQLKFRGLMCVPEAEDIVLLEQQMVTMQQAYLKLKSQIVSVDVLSMGMSQDLELAVKYGATHVRIGAALFGLRT